MSLSDKFPAAAEQAGNINHQINIACAVPGVIAQAIYRDVSEKKEVQAVKAESPSSARLSGRLHQCSCWTVTRVTLVRKPGLV